TILGATVEQEKSIVVANRNRRLDMLVHAGGSKVVIELRGRFFRSILEQGIQQLQDFIPAVDATGGILVFWDADLHEYDVTQVKMPGSQVSIRVVARAGLRIGPSTGE